MSSDFPNEPAEVATSLSTELRQFTALSSALFRAAAAAVNMTVTEFEVVDVLDGSGPVTPGDLAEVTGLTTGAIAGMLNRLEETGLLRRERDPADGRRVLVRLDTSSERFREVESAFATLKRGWDQVTSPFDPSQIATVTEFVRRSSAQTRAGIVRLREGHGEEAAVRSAPSDGISRGFLSIVGATEVTIRVDSGMNDLYRARFDGSVPDVKETDGTIAIRYARRFSNLFGAQRATVVTLGTTVPWDIDIEGGGAVITAELVGLALSRFEANGGGSVIRVDLPNPESSVPVRLSGGASSIQVRRPVGVGLRAHLKGSSSHFVLDGQICDTTGRDSWAESVDYDPAVAGYAVEITSSASLVNISTM